jgi:hypothetical protein
MVNGYTLIYIHVVFALKGLSSILLLPSGCMWPNLPAVGVFTDRKKSSNKFCRDCCIEQVGENTNPGHLYFVRGDTFYKYGRCSAPLAVYYQKVSAQIIHFVD